MFNRSNMILAAACLLVIVLPSQAAAPQVGYTHGVYAVGNGSTAEGTYTLPTTVVSKPVTGCSPGGNNPYNAEFTTKGGNITFQMQNPNAGIQVMNNWSKSDVNTCSRITDTREQICSDPRNPQTCVNNPNVGNMMDNTCNISWNDGNCTGVTFIVKAG